MAEKYVRIGTGAADLQEIEATVESTGASEAGNIIGLDAGGKLDESLFPTGIGADTKLIEASENLSAGDFVNVFNDSGTVKVRRADASSVGREANGFVLSAVTAPNNATVYFSGINDELTGLDLGAIYYLSTTAGDVATTRPSTAGQFVQKLGRTLSATEISFEHHSTIEVA